MTDVTVIVGAQYGSEGKGAVAGYLGRTMGPRDVAVRVAGPNAGHTAYDSNGREWKLRAAPVAAATSTDCQLHIAAGSEVDFDVLVAELRHLDEAGHRASERLTIHPSATVLLPNHRFQEGERELVRRIGSTGKGIGAARADRIWRTALTVEQYLDATETNLKSTFRGMLSDPGPFDLDARHVVIEGTQGYGLGLHTENYPQVTSSDCRAIDFLAMTGISPWDDRVTQLNVICVARVYPIRVAGNSGPLKDETDWETLGLPTERTTVTNLIRRVGAWDQDLVAEAVVANGGGSFNPTVTLAITMLDQKFPELRDKTELTDEHARFLNEIASSVGADVRLVGTGPDTMFTVS